MRSSSSIATSRSEWPTRPASSTPRSASSASSAAARISSISPSSLTARRRSTTPAHSASSQPCGSAAARRARSATVVLASSIAEPAARALERAGGGIDEAARDDLARELLRDLRGRLGRVTEVREEAVLARLPGRDQREPVAAREAAQVAQVDRRRHEQRVELALAQRHREALDTRELAGRAGAHRAPPSSCSCSSSSAST